MHDVGIKKCHLGDYEWFRLHCGSANIEYQIIHESGRLYLLRIHRRDEGEYVSIETREKRDCPNRIIYWKALASHDIDVILSDIPNFINKHKDLIQQHVISLEGN